MLSSGISAWSYPSPQRSSRLAWEYVATVAVIDFWFMPIPLPCLFSHWVPPYAMCEFETTSVFQWEVDLSGHHHWTASQITSIWQECLWVMENESLPIDKEHCETPPNRPHFWNLFLDISCKRFQLISHPIALWNWNMREKQYQNNWHNLLESLFLDSSGTRFHSHV